MAQEMLDRRCRKLFPPGFGSRPWLFQMHGTQKQTATFVDPINNTMEEKALPEVQGKTCLGCYGEWMLLADELTRECFFLSITSLTKIYIPPLPEAPDFFRTNVRITSPPDTSSCIVILICFSKTFLLLCSPGSKRWNKVHIKYLTKNNHSLWGASAVYKKHLFVVTALDVTLAIDVALLARGLVKMTVIDRLKQSPMLYCWTTYLVKCAGDLFSIQLHSYHQGQIITHVEVRRLELSGEGSNEMHWRRVQDIGDHAFFLAGRCGRSLRANKTWGAQHSCIYYPVQCCDGMRLYKFCLDDQILTFIFITETNGDLNRLQWAFPTKRLVSIFQKYFLINPSFSLVTSCINWIYIFLQNANYCRRCFKFI
jgi:Protein of unknown function (DUF295)